MLKAQLYYHSNSGISKSDVYKSQVDILIDYSGLSGLLEEPVK